MEVVSHATPHPPTSSTSSKTNWNASTSTLTHERRCWPEDSHWRPTHWFFWHIFAHRCRTDRRRSALCAPIQPFIHRYSAPTTAARRAFPDRFRTEINTFINICVIIHPFAQHRSGLTRTRLRMTYCCCSRTSLHLNICGGRESNRRGGEKKKKDFACSHTCSFTRNPTAKSPYEQLTRWNRLKNNQNPNVTL